MAMSIRTKRGDLGETGLYTGERLCKNDLIFDVLGDLDELTVWIGLCSVHCSVIMNYFESEILFLDLRDIQRLLFTLSSEIATIKSKRPKLKAILNKDNLNQLESDCKLLESLMEMPRDFVLPCATKESGYLEHARVSSRKCERRVLELIHSKRFSNYDSLAWLNCLSDYFWLLARTEEGNDKVIFQKELKEQEYHKRVKIKQKQKTSDLK